VELVRVSMLRLRGIGQRKTHVGCKAHWLSHSLARNIPCANLVAEKSSNSAAAEQTRGAVASRLSADRRSHTGAAQGFFFRCTLETR